MEIIIKGEAKEIASLVLLVQERANTVQNSAQVRTHAGDSYHAAGYNSETGESWYI